VVLLVSVTLWSPCAVPTVIPPMVIPCAWTEPDRTRRFASSMFRKLLEPLADIYYSGRFFLAKWVALWRNFL